MGCGAKLANQRNTAWLGTALFFGLHDKIGGEQSRRRLESRRLYLNMIYKCQP